MNAATNQLVSPKCQGAMRSYERNGIVIDQCQECRGVFLDRGELEKLIEAESATVAAPPARSEGYERDRYEGGHGRGHGGKRRKKSGFLGELFD